MEATEDNSGLSGKYSMMTTGQSSMHSHDKAESSD